METLLVSQKSASQSPALFLSPSPHFLMTFDFPTFVFQSPIFVSMSCFGVIKFFLDICVKGFNFIIFGLWICNIDLNDGYVKSSVGICKVSFYNIRRCFVFYILSKKCLLYTLNTFILLYIIMSIISTNFCISWSLRKFHHRACVLGWIWQVSQYIYCILEPPSFRCV